MTYIFIDSDQSNVYFSDNTGTSFTAVIDQELSPDSHQEVALKEITVQATDALCGLYLITSSIAQPSSTYGTQQNTLRPIELCVNKRKSGQTIVFEEGYYVPISSTSGGFIKFDITPIDSKAKGDIKRVWVTLHFRRKRH